jgi:Regulator of ribonuclease activity B
LVFQLPFTPSSKGAALDCFRRAVLSDCYLKESALRWPYDAHGDGLRKLHADGFDFSKRVLIDFKVFFEVRPHKDAMVRLSQEYPSVAWCGIDDESAGYLEFQVYALLSYDLVNNTTSYVTELMSPYRGACLSWGVDFEPERCEVFSVELGEGNDLSYSL